MNISRTNSLNSRLSETKLNDEQQLVGRSRQSEPYQPPESLWQLIKSVANEKELDVIKSFIGESLIETSIDLHNEIDSLLEIWRDYRNETDQSLNQIKDKINKNSTLPEPPNIRETLKKEIQLFVKQMRELCKEEETFCRQILKNNHNLNVINYVLNSSLNKQEMFNLSQKDNSTNEGQLARNDTTNYIIERPATVLDKRTGIETPILKGSTSGRKSRQQIRYRSVSRSSSLGSARADYSTLQNTTNRSIESQLQQPTSLISENVELIVDEDKINSTQIDEIAENLREMLQQECDSLLEDIEILYECIDKEKEYRVQTKQTLHEPSINELKEERKRLEDDLLSSTRQNQIKISKLPSSVSRANNNRSINSPIMSNRATPSPPNSASSVKSRSSVVSTNRIKIGDLSTRTNNEIAKRSSSLAPEAEKAKLSNLNIQTKKLENNLNTTTKQSLKSNTNTTKNNQQINSNMNRAKSITKENNIEHKHLIARSNSISSVTSSVSSSASSINSSRLSSVQKFRRMVLDSRDT